MLKIWALATVLVIFTWNLTSAKTLKDLDKSHLNELEGSGYAESSPFPGHMNEYGSGYSSGDYNDEDPIDDEDEDELDNYINNPDVDEVEESPVLSNEVIVNKNAPSRDDDINNRIALASTNNNSSVFASTEMLAAMIAGGTIGLLFAILLILLLVYRMRKKDEGSYDLSKKPIYKKAPTTEFYA